jgi:hypothetical protein
MFKTSINKSAALIFAISSLSFQTTALAGNNATVVQNGSVNSSHINQRGYRNNARLNQRGCDNNGRIGQSGGYNNARVNQSSRRCRSRRRCY